MEEELSTTCCATADALEILSKFTARFYEKCYTSDKFNGGLCQSSSQLSFKLNFRLLQRKVLSLIPNKLAILTQEKCSSRKNSISSFSMTPDDWSSCTCKFGGRASEQIWHRCFNGNFCPHTLSSHEKESVLLSKHLLLLSRSLERQNPHFAQLCAIATIKLKLYLPGAS